MRDLHHVVLAAKAQPTSLPSLHTLAITRSDEDKSLSSTYHHLRGKLANSASARSALQGLSQNLRILDLGQLPLEFWRDEAIVSASLLLPFLEDLRLRIRTTYHTTTDYESILQTSLCPFINRHSKSLKRLELRNRDLRRSPAYYYRYGALFRHLTRIHGLTELSVRFTLACSDTESLDALAQFIGVHSGSLSQLDLSLYHSTLTCLEPAQSQPNAPMRQLELDMLTAPYTPQTLFNHPLFRTTLPSCRTLKHLYCILLSEDSLQLRPAPFFSWLPLLKRSSALTKLSLPYNLFNQPDLITLISTTDLSSLRSLRLKVQALDMALFDAFAAKLPSLQDLTVCAYSLLCELADGSQVEVRPLFLLPSICADYNSSGRL